MIFHIHISLFIYSYSTFITFLVTIITENPGKLQFSYEPTSITLNVNCQRRNLSPAKLLYKTVLYQRPIK